MPELGPYGSVRGARGNSRPYRESPNCGQSGQLLTDCVEKVESAASGKFAQKRADGRLRLAMPS
jgi:hypothetical protein